MLSDFSERIYNLLILMNATDGVHLTSIINKLLQLNKECSFLFHYFPKEGPIVSLNSDNDKFRFRMGIPLTASLE